MLGFDSECNLSKNGEDENIYTKIIQSHSLMSVEQVIYDTYVVLLNSCHIIITQVSQALTQSLASMENKMWITESNITWYDYCKVIFFLVIHFCFQPYNWFFYVYVCVFLSFANKNIGHLVLWKRFKKTKKHKTKQNKKTKNNNNNNNNKIPDSMGGKERPQAHWLSSRVGRSVSRNFFFFVIFF